MYNKNTKLSYPTAHKNIIRGVIWLTWLKDATLSKSVMADIITTFIIVCHNFVQDIYNYVLETDHGSVENKVAVIYGYYYYYYVYLLYIGYSPVCPQTNHVPSGYTVAATLSFYCQYAVRCVSPSFLRRFWWSSTSALSAECVQCLMWLFSVVPELHGFPVCCPRIS